MKCPLALRSTKNWTMWHNLFQHKIYVYIAVRWVINDPPPKKKKQKKKLYKYDCFVVHFFKY